MKGIPVILPLIATILYFIVIALHIYFMALEMLLWKSKGPKVFGFSREFAESTAALASNQGLYNGFLVAALLIGMLSKDYEMFKAFGLYGLSCVIVAGIWGGITVNKRIFFVQAVPALLALGLYILSLQPG